MTAAEAHAAAQMMEDLVEALLDAGAIALEDLPPALLRSVGRRRILMQKLFGGAVRPASPTCIWHRQGGMR